MKLGLELSWGLRNHACEKFWIYRMYFLKIGKIKKNYKLFEMLYEIGHN